MPTKVQMIRSKAIEILKSSPDGIRYSKLSEAVHHELTDIAVNTVYTVISELHTQLPNEVYKPARGLFRHVIFREQEIGPKEQRTKPQIEKIKEEDFYEPFANWLVNEIEECTKAIPLGGNKFKDKWGTPDVIGKWEPRESDIIKVPKEIVSAEMKIDTYNLITAFGQACSYKLFSHKSYIVIPKNSSQDDISKLDALCLIFGIGLVLLDFTNPKDPQFDIRVRPIKHEPDMFYVNKYMKLIEQDLFG